MDYCKDTRALLTAYKRETDAQILAMQRKIYELQTRVYHLELEKYLETRKKIDKI